MERSHPLVIGLGNSLRSDDGVGIKLAQILGSRVPTLRVLLYYQLTPELAAAISEARAMLFVDARMMVPALINSAATAQPLLEPLQPSRSGDPGGHALTPARLLALSAALYGPCPPAWQLLIPGEHWEVGDQLSRSAAAACRAALPLALAWGAAHA